LLPSPLVSSQMPLEIWVAEEDASAKGSDCSLF
jgi:hypothetical protein